MIAEHPLVDVYSQLPIEPVRGDGVFVYTDTGRRILDMYGGHATASLGYAHPALLAALRKQSQELFFQSNIVPLAIRDKAAKALVSFAPEGISSVFFVNSGAEANENALRLACRFTGRGKVVTISGGFHGRTAAAAALTDGADRWYGFPRAPFDVVRVSRESVDELVNAIDETVAAVMFEPVQGIGGAFAAGREFLQAARDRCSATGSLLIFDEVQCGVGRTGHPFAAQYFSVTPDMITTAKAIAGGFPAGALLMSPALGDFVGRGDMGSTFGGGPMACALIEAVISTIHRDNLLQNVQDVSAYLFENIRVGPVTDVQGVGFLIGLRTSRPASEIRAELLDHDILAGGAADPNIVRLLPSLILQKEHVDLLIAALATIGK